VNDCLATAIYWIANLLAVLLLIISVLAAWLENDDLITIPAFLASVVWLSGRVCLFVLADR
jgi:hypothetical protein